MFFFGGGYSSCRLFPTEAGDGSRHVSTRRGWDAGFWGDYSSCRLFPTEAGDGSRHVSTRRGWDAGFWGVFLWNTDVFHRATFFNRNAKRMATTDNGIKTEEWRRMQETTAPLNASTYRHHRPKPPPACAPTRSRHKARRLFPSLYTQWP